MPILSPSRWNDEVLDAFRMVGDPLADQVIEEIFTTGSITEVNRLMRNLMRNDAPAPKELPAAVYHYFETTDGLPEWADLDAIARSQEFFMRNGLLAILILSSYSLPICYAAARGVKVIYESARLYSDPRGRVIETSQMLLDTLAPSGLDRNGSGVRTMQKVRLMHAAVRKLLMQRGWDVAHLGIPINQEDMAGTMGTFGFCFVDGLSKLNVEISSREADDYIHTWNVIGHITGVQRPLHPRNMAEASHLADRINERHFAPSPEGQAMQEAMTGYLQSLLPGTILNGLPTTLTRLFIGEERANAIGLPPNDWTRVSFGPLRLVNGLVSNANSEITSLARATSFLGQKMIENLLTNQNGGRRTELQIPHQLKEAWGIA